MTLSLITQTLALLIANATCEPWNAECYYDAGVSDAVTWEVMQARYHTGEEYQPACGDDCDVACDTDDDCAATFGGEY